MCVMLDVWLVPSCDNLLPSCTLLLLQGLFKFPSPATNDNKIVQSLTLAFKVTKDKYPKICNKKIFEKQTELQETYLIHKVVKTLLSYATTNEIFMVSATFAL